MVLADGPNQPSFFVARLAVPLESHQSLPTFFIMVFKFVGALQISKRVGDHHAMQRAFTNFLHTLCSKSRIFV